MALSVPAVRIRGRTHRLIAARWPTTGIFDTVASPEDVREAVLLAGWTDDQLNAQLARLTLVPEQDRILGRPGATLIMAAFLHTAPGGGRFTSESLGAWYAARDLRTAIAETVHHHMRRLAHSASGFRHTIQMRQLIAVIDAALHDIRQSRDEAPELYDPDDYTASQRFGESLRKDGSNGIVYGSVRRAGGENVAIFRPRLLAPILQGDQFEYRWSGTPEPQIVRLVSP